MKTYDVTITETLQKTVRIHADSPEEAEQKAEDNWNASQYNLDSNHFVGAWGDGREKAR